MAWVLGTQSGLRFALGVTEDLAPGLLRVERAEGRVLGDLRLTGVAVRAPGLALDLGEAVLRWSPLGVLGGRLRVRELALRDIDLLAQAKEEPEEEEPEEGAPLQLPQVALPVAIELEQVLVERLSVRREAGAPPFVVDRASLSAVLDAGRLELRELGLALPEPRLEASAAGGAELTGDYPLDLTLRWSLSQAPALELAGEGELRGDLARLEAGHRLTGVAQAQLEARLSDLLDDPRWEADLTVTRVDLPAVRADLPAADVQGRLSTSGDLGEARVQGSVSGTAPEDLPGFGRLDLELDVTWSGRVLDIVALELREEESGALLTADGELDLSGEPGRFAVGAAWERLRWPLDGTPLAEARQGKLDAAGTFEAYGYALEAVAWGPDLPETVLRLEGEGDRQATRIRALELELLEGRVSAAGTVGWSPKPAWDLAVTADGIDTAGQWPQLPARLALELNSAGDLDAFVYDLVGQMRSEALPPADLSLAGSGDVRGTRVERLALDTLGGRVEARAEAGWDPRVSWDARVDVAGIDPGAQWPDWPGELGGRLASAGSLEDAGPDLTAALEGFAGVLRGYPVKGDGRLSVRGGDVRIEALNLASGPSSVSAEGRAGETLELRFDIRSPDLRSLLPEAAGSVSASGSVAGTPAAPDVRLDLEATGVEVAGQGIERLRGDARLDLAGGGALRVDLAGTGLLAGGMRFDALKVTGDGDLASHRLVASLQGEPLALGLEAGGALGEGGAYRGRIAALSLDSPDFGDWRLQGQADVALEGATVSAGPLCVRDQGGSGGCVEFAQGGPGQWTAGLDLDRVAFDLVAPFLPEGLALDGYARAKASFSAEGGALAGQADLSVPEGVVRTAAGGSGAELVNFSTTRVGVEAGASGLKGALDLPLAGLGGVSGELSLPGWSLADPARPDQALRGRIRADVDDLGVVSRLVPDVTDVTGGIDVDLGLSGSIGRPGVSGQARLAGGGLQVPLIGLTLADVEFNAEARTLERIEYSGGLSAGDGRLEITGQTLLGSAGADTKLEASGERLTLADSREYFLLASPDIRVDAGPGGAAVEGEVTIPEARIRPRSIPAGTQSPSPDVVVATELQEQSAYPLDLDLRLVLGRNVSVDAFGLKARLAGDLRIFQEPGRELLGDGQLEVIDGTYRLSSGLRLTAAIGRPLTVEQGIVVFAKTPLSNPGLVLTAKREGGDVTAGVRVFGTVKDPKLTFFSDSDPGMTQAEASSYLITGIPPGGSGGSGTQGLSLGTYVAPKLFMEYESSLGEEQDKVKLRYDLNNWVELQTETGDSQGADVFFKFER
jgi:translocation and assembly module TamB